MKGVMTEQANELSYEDNVYMDVMALYAAIKDTPGAIKVRRAEMRQGEVPAEPLDFIIDVELKAKRAILADIDPAYATAEWMTVMYHPELYPHLPVVIREELGREFEAKRLGVDGDYRLLYFKVKNYHQNYTQEDTNGIFD